MKNKIIIVAALMLILAIVNYKRISTGQVRSVEFISILSIGIFSGVLLSELIKMRKNKKGLSN